MLARQLLLEPARANSPGTTSRAWWTGEQDTIHRKELEELAGKGRAVGVGLWVDLVRMPPSGTWERRRADHFALAEAWDGPPQLAEGEAVERLVRRYLAGFGPASVADMQSYSGLPRAARAAPPCCRRSTARGSSAHATRTRCRRSSSTAPSPAPGATPAGASSSNRFAR